VAILVEHHRQGLALGALLLLALVLTLLGGGLLGLAPGGGSGRQAPGFLLEKAGVAAGCPGPLHSPGHAAPQTGDAALRSWRPSAAAGGAAGALRPHSLCPPRRRCRREVHTGGRPWTSQGRAFCHSPGPT